MMEVLVSMGKLEEIDQNLRAFDRLILKYWMRSDKGEELSKEDTLLFLSKAMDLISIDAEILLQCSKMLLKDNQEMVAILQRGVEAKNMEEFDTVQTAMLKKLASLSFSE